MKRYFRSALWFGLPFLATCFGLDVVEVAKDGPRRLHTWPFWAVNVLGTIAIAVIATVASAREDTRQERERQKLGLCTHCGYDPRASAERCAECGSLLPK